MIKINLIEQKRAVNVTNIGGIDLTKVSVIGWVAAAAIYFIGPSYFDSEWKQLRSIEEDKIKERKATLKQLNKKVRENQVLKEKLDAFNRREQLLKEREAQVEEIIKRRTNPMKLLLHLARNIPEDLWVDIIHIDGNQIKIEGESISYKSIGKFLNAANNSIYFNRQLKIAGVSTKQSKKKGKDSAAYKKVRTEAFKIDGKIARFE